MSETSPAIPIQTPEERTLAANMAIRAGYLSVSHAAAEEGPVLTYTDYQNLAANFADNERQSLESMRDTLMDIQGDRLLSDQEKAAKLDRSFDAYTNWTLSLDRAAFPMTRDEDGDLEIGIGIPAYIPDGFVDLRREPTTDFAQRTSEMITVDKRGVYERYKPLLIDIFAKDYSGMTEAEVDMDMMLTLAKGIAEELPIDSEIEELGYEAIDLAEIPEGVCRHRALTYQVLAQAVGLRSHMVKGKLAGTEKDQWTPHAVNLVEVGDQWMLVDITYDDWKDGDPEDQWLPSLIPVSGPPRPHVDRPGSEVRLYTGRTMYRGNEYIFRTNHEAYWTIARQSAA